MSQISKALENGFEKYYNTLVQLGSVDIKAVSSLIIASWINDVLEGKYDCLVDDEQYTLLSELYTCIEGSCLVPYQKYCRDITVNKLPDNRYVRMTEINTLDFEGNGAGNRERMLEASDDLRMI